MGVAPASALDAGGSSTMAFGGQLLSRPSDTGGERMVAESFLMSYYGVYAPQPEPSFSPNGDGAGDKQELSFKIVRQSNVSATDSEGKTSKAERSFNLNNTLGFISVKPLRATVKRKRGGRVTIGFQLTRAARVSITITSKTGQLLRVIRNAKAPAGRVVVVWNGKYPNGKTV